MMNRLIGTFVFAMSFSITYGQDKVSIDQFSWLSGHWIGDGFGGVSEEVWSEPRGGSMVGLYRHLKDNGETNNFYEILTIYEDEGSIKLRLKHVNPDMTGWEEKDDFVNFPFVSIEEGKAVFKGLIYELTGPNTMQITLTLSNKDKKWDEVFTFKRTENFPNTD